MTNVERDFAYFDLLEIGGLIRTEKLTSPTGLQFVAGRFRKSWRVSAGATFQKVAGGQRIRPNLTSSCTASLKRGRA